MEIDMEKVKALRMEKSLSLRELGDKAGMSKDTIWRIEQGISTRPYPSTIRQLAEALGVTPLELQK